MIRVVYGGGAQAVSHVPRDVTGRAVVVASATYEILDLRYPVDSADRTIVASTAATVDAVSTTISAAAGPTTADPRKITVASATGITRNTPYLLATATTGASEVVQVEQVTSTVVLVREPIASAFASASTFKGLAVSGTFPSVTANDEDLFELGGGPYLVRWTYTAAGVAITREDVAFVVRALESCPATAAEVRERYPEIGAGQVGGQSHLAQYLGAAWRALQVDLLSRGLELQDIKSELATDAVCAGAAAKLYRWTAIGAGENGDRYSDLADRTEARYREILDALSRGLDKPGTVRIDRNDATAPAGSSRGYSRRFAPR